MNLGAERATESEAKVHEILRARLHRSMRFTVFCIPFSIPLLALLLWSRTDNPGLLLIWTALALGTGLLQWLSYLRKDPTGLWIKRAIGSQVVAGVVWGLFPWMTMPVDPVWQAMCGGVLIAVLMGAANFTSAIRPASAAFLIPAGVLGGVGFVVMSTGDVRWSGLSILAIAGFAAVLAEASYRNQHKSATLTVQVHQQARTDDLTGLTNRAGFVEALEEALSHGSNIVGVAFLDLDGFKNVNDQMGHAAGDDLLVAVGARLVERLGDDALVARYGGDEFTFVVPETTEIEMADIKRRIVDAFSEPFSLEADEARIGASVGVSLSSPGTSLDSALRHADDAQYQAKRRVHAQAAGGARASSSRAIDGRPR